jgi:hypothetical protein
MHRTRGWVAAAAIVAAGCGGPGGTSVQTTTDEHEGPAVVCAGCKVTGGGQIQLNGETVQFAAEAIPESGPAAGPGFGGVGVAAKGHIQFNTVPPAPGGIDLRGSVDTIVSCSRTDGILASTFSGVLESGGRFTVVVTDGGEPADDTISLDSLLVDFDAAVYHGNLQVHELDRCEPPCGEGMCWCEQEQQCEPCDGVNEPPPPVCLEGTCWCEDTKTCEPCQPPPLVDPPPPPPPPLPP